MVYGFARTWLPWKYDLGVTDEHDSGARRETTLPMVWCRSSQTASTSAEALALSKDLKKLGWQFVGPTTTYAFMQAMGLINDHVEGCVIRGKVVRARKSFTRPERTRPR